jgi:peptide deformylase
VAPLRNTIISPPKFRILHYEHPLLREKARDVRGVGRRERELIAAMAETMYAAPGCGLAATQVGLLERIFVADIDYDRDDPSVERSLRVYINPEIVWESDEDESLREGCLSLPGLEAEVFRPERIRVVARDENFEEFTVDADGLLARVIQHENDHLQGIMFVDRLPLLKRKLLSVKLNKMNRDTESSMPPPGTTYPVIIA